MARKVIVKKRLTVKQQIAGLESDECDRYEGLMHKTSAPLNAMGGERKDLAATVGATSRGFATERNVGATGSLRPRAGLGGGRSLPRIASKPSSTLDSKRSLTKNTEF